MKRPHHTRTENSKDNWETPQYFFEILHQEFQFTLDPCASDENHKCEKYFTKEMDGLKLSWKGEKIFCNPPYKEKEKFILKAFEETKNGCVLAALLIPDTTDTKIWHSVIFPFADEIRFVNGRIQFLDSVSKKPIPGNPRGSAVVIFRNRKIHDLLQVSTINHKVIAE